MVIDVIDTSIDSQFFPIFLRTPWLKKAMYKTKSKQKKERKKTNLINKR